MYKKMSFVLCQNFSPRISWSGFGCVRKKKKKRPQMAIALEAKNILFNTLTNNCSVADVVIFDTDYKCVHAAGDMSCHEDIDPKRLVGQNVFDVMSESYQNMFKDLFDRALQRGRHSQIVLMRPDAQYLVRIVPLKIKSGSERYILGGILYTQECVSLQYLKKSGESSPEKLKVSV